MAGNAYIINCTPFPLNFIVNSGTPTRVNPIAPTPPSLPSTPPGLGTVASNAYVVPYSSGLSGDQIGGTNNPGAGTTNSLYVSGSPFRGGASPTYKIVVNSNTVPLTSDVYLWVFVDSVYGADSAGQSQGFTITKSMATAQTV